MDNTKKVQRKKQLLYVEAYEKMEQQIDEMYNHGDKLPPEHEWATALSISRGTLRQALALLREDGRIYNQPGKGNFVIGKGAVGKPLNLSVLLGPSSNIVAYSQTLCSAFYTPASQKMMDIFSLDVPGILLNLCVKYMVQEDVVGYALILMPYDRLCDVTNEFDNAQLMYEDLTRYIQHEVGQVDTKFNAVAARENIANQMQLQEGTPLLHMNDVMFSQTHKPIIYMSSYYLCDYYDFRIKR